MPDAKAAMPMPSTVEDDREAYFAGRISAQEYLSRSLPQQPDLQEPDHHGLTEQLKRILDRLTRKSRPHTP